MGLWEGRLRSGVCVCICVADRCEFVTDIGLKKFLAALKVATNVTNVKLSGTLLYT